MDARRRGAWAGWRGARRGVAAAGQKEDQGKCRRGRTVCRSHALV